MTEPTRREYFERLYETDPDPWGFETSWYEQRKYQLCVAALPEPRYRSAFEPGCSVGVLTEILATRCDHLLATDIIPAALRRARQRLACADHVRVESRTVPVDWPDDETFDLVVLSELAYYFDPRGLRELTSLAVGSLDAGGTLLAAHWRGQTDYPLSGDEAQSLIGATPDLDPLSHYEQDEFVLDIWRRR